MVFDADKSMFEEFVAISQQTKVEEQHADEVRKLRRDQRTVIRRMEKSGLIVDKLLHRSRDKRKGKHHLEGQLYYGISASLDRLKDQAELMELELKVKDEYGGGFAPYKRRFEDLFQVCDEKRYFKRTDRMRIVMNIIRSRRRQRGADLNLPRLQDKNIVNKFYPLHDKVENDWLIANWVKTFWRTQPLERIRDYFGEKLGLYFSWLGYYTIWLAVAAVFGLGIFATRLARGIENPNIPALAYSIGISLWGTLFTEFWKRKSASIAHRWNMLYWEEDEAERPNYHGKKKRGIWFHHQFVFLKDYKHDNRFNKLKAKFYSGFKRGMKIFLGSWPLVIFLVLFVIASMFGLILVKSILSSIPTIGSVVGSIINAVVILILEWIYVKIATRLTEWENWKYESEFENAVVLKRYLFEFVNAYASLFYTAFLKSYLGLNSALVNDFEANCRPTDPNYNEQQCIMAELEMSLGITFVTRIVVSQFMELAVPFLRSKLCAYCQKRKFNEDLHEIQRQAYLSPYAGTIDEYEEMAIQFGYVTLFASAFPLAPLCALINNIIEIRTDAWKFVSLTQRPRWEGAKSIGTFQRLMELTSYLSIITNCSLVAFTSSKWDNLTTPFIIFILLENGAFAIKFLLSRAIPDVPAHVKRDEAKEKFLVQELMDESGEPAFWEDSDEEYEEGDRIVAVDAAEAEDSHHTDGAASNEE